MRFCDDDLKEKHFFSVPSNFAKGVDWYIKEFPLKCRTKADSLTLDATPGYICTQNVSNLIGTFYKNQELARKKFILILRDPVARLVIIGLFILKLDCDLYYTVLIVSILNINFGFDGVCGDSLTT